MLLSFHERLPVLSDIFLQRIPIYNIYLPPRSPRMMAGVRTPPFSAALPVRAGGTGTPWGSTRGLPGGIWGKPGGPGSLRATRHHPVSSSAHTARHTWPVIPADTRPALDECRADIPPTLAQRPIPHRPREHLSRTDLWRQRPLELTGNAPQLCRRKIRPVECSARKKQYEI